MNNEHGIIPPNATWKEMTEGGNIYESGNAKYFKTGDWKSMHPVFHSEECKQCLLCVPMCPDNAIPLDENGNRKDFDYSVCKGCGVCAKACPFKAIEMKEGAE